ncbi:hypothetical protein [Natranaeroarchaeum aerophilus]|uniref:DUF8048 domain-containing protein n=1 Tax=Natranaeroarchaeum aerophilus TaxID=2917711 RepID=A0AAE3FPT7_9EURY|nr:hypothetical protein [Natranaeroarchaeum aerophilus]MCL9812658.1 hypothetical protein [Natranaeroarchaeum aerophilus]
MTDSERTHPIEGQTVLLAGARASVTLSQLSALLERAQQQLVDQRVEYARQFEGIDGTDGRTYFLASDGHWARVGEELGLTDREADALRRAHESQFLRDGRTLDRLDEFETSVEIREPVAIAQP